MPLPPPHTPVLPPPPHTPVPGRRSVFAAEAEDTPLASPRHFLLGQPPHTTPPPPDFEDEETAVDSAGLVAARKRLWDAKLSSSSGFRCTRVTGTPLGSTSMLSAKAVAPAAPAAAAVAPAAAAAAGRLEQQLLSDLRSLLPGRPPAAAARERAPRVMDSAASVMDSALRAAAEIARTAWAQPTTPSSSRRAERVPAAPASERDERASDRRRCDCLQPSDARPLGVALPSSCTLQQCSFEPTDEQMLREGYIGARPRMAPALRPDSVLLLEDEGIDGVAPGCVAS